MTATYEPNEWQYDEVFMESVALVAELNECGVAGCELVSITRRRSSARSMRRSDNTVLLLQARLTATSNRLHSYRCPLLTAPPRGQVLIRSDRSCLQKPCPCWRPPVRHCRAARQRSGFLGAMSRLRR